MISTSYVTYCNVQYLGSILLYSGSRIRPEQTTTLTANIKKNNVSKTGLHNDGIYRQPLNGVYHNYYVLNIGRLHSIYLLDRYSVIKYFSSDIDSYNFCVTFNGLFKTHFKTNFVNCTLIKVNNAYIVEYK